MINFLIDVFSAEKIRFQRIDFAEKKIHDTFLVC